MKKLIISTIVMISTCITIYFIAVWEPSIGEDAIGVNSNSIESRKTNITKDNEIYKREKEEEKVYNIDKKEILSRLTIEERENLTSITKKISTIDMAKVKESLQSENDKEGLINAMRIVKKRLLNEDYLKIKEILSPYINVDILEKSI